MFSPSENFYAAWRTQCVTANVLHDENGTPAERLLQAVWQHQRLQRDQLKTADGKIVRIFHPGFVSVEGGPDFCGAIIQIGDDAPRAGDVEVDLRSGGWRAHGHDKNKHFQNVMLHVVWDEEFPGARPGVQSSPEVLSLKNVLDAPLADAERRDVKGLYRRARMGQLKNFTGIDSPYEPPEQPEIHLDMSQLSIEDAAARVIDHLRRVHSAAAALGS